MSKKSVENACQTAARTLAGWPHDLPFVLLYLLSDDGRDAMLVGRTGLDSSSPACPGRVTMDDGPWPFRQVVQTGAAELVDDITQRFGDLAAGVWPEPIAQAIVLPIAKPGQTRPAGFVVAGVSPRLVYDDAYKGFLELLAGHIATAISSARAYEEERRRAEALAELDRAKTAFFSNVSHEFRTPLTLILGPVSDALAEPRESSRSCVGTIWMWSIGTPCGCNGWSNALLDFSRIEAGRVRASYEPIDVASFTAELASVFRSACERAGLRLDVDCPPLPEPVYLDREMWEKIVLNLLSNAFKFTLEGQIRVAVRQGPRATVLRVQDTGVGIPAEEMPRLFERFHRVDNARGRTHEGSGIGLALVQELIKLHGGSITARSELGQGTTFPSHNPARQSTPAHGTDQPQPLPSSSQHLGQSVRRGSHALAA